jgi:DNA-binding MarR family transcriptional regulator
MNRSDADGREVLAFMQRLWALDHKLQMLSKRMRQEFGITGPQRIVIRLVGEYPGISAGKLAEELHVHPSTLTGVFRRLEADGFLIRRVDPVDSRRALFQLTAKGRKINNLRQGTVEEAVRRSLQRISPDEVASARNVLESLARDLDPDR